MSFLDFCFSSNWERERVVYKIWVYRRNGPKVTYLIFRQGSTGESFFFHGLIDFKLFLILAWRTRVPRVSDILLGVNGYGSVCHEPFPIINFLIIYFRWGEGVPTSVLGSQPTTWLLPSSPSGVRRPEVTKYQHLLISPLWPTFFLNGHFFDGLPRFIQTGG